MVGGGEGEIERRKDQDSFIYTILTSNIPIIKSGSEREGEGGDPHFTITTEWGRKEREGKKKPLARGIQTPPRRAYH